jgi:hypothetical protein
VISQTHTLQGVVDGTVTVNGSVMATCAAAIQSVAGTCTFGTDITTKCENVFNGTVADGQPCRFADECKRGDGPVVCLKVSTSSVSSPETGVCHPLQRGASGSPCIFSASGNLAGATYTSPDPNPPLVFCHSDDGLSCSSPSRTCTPLAALGTSCAGGGACAAGLYCHTTCRQKKSEGETCTGSGECADPFACKSGSCAPIPVASDKLCGGDYN